MGFTLFLIILFSTASVYAGDVTLAWDPPTTNVDNSPLTDLAGYVLYSGTSSGNYTDSVDVGNVTTYHLTGLTEGLTYYFVVTAYDAAGNESGYSNEEGKLIETTPPDNDGDGYDDSEDCNDNDNTVYPGALELCDSLDNDCDGQTDEGLLSTYYRDFDGDMYGDPLTTIDECAQPVGYVVDNTDCDDNAWEINPGVTEGPPDDLTCSDANDNDCNGFIDAEDPGCIECLGPICLPVESDQILNLVTWYYQSILDRAPEQGGAEAWTAEIQRILSLGIDIKEGFITLGKLFFNSEEYLLKGKTDEEYIIDLYETFLGRSPSLEEVDVWSEELASELPRNLLLNYLFFSDEFRVFMECEFGLCVVRPEYTLVNDLYRSFLSRLPDDNGFNPWLALMQEAQCAGENAVRDVTLDLALTFLNSPEYTARGRDNSEYITDLYDGILRRGAGVNEIESWFPFLDTNSREDLLVLFVDSEEFQVRVQEVIDAGCSLP